MCTCRDISHSICSGLAPPHQVQHMLRQLNGLNSMVLRTPHQVCLTISHIHPHSNYLELLEEWAVKTRSERRAACSCGGWHLVGGLERRAWAAATGGAAHSKEGYSSVQNCKINIALYSVKIHYICSSAGISIYICSSAGISICTIHLDGQTSKDRSCVVSS
jgi:hypothetical protein